MKHKHSQSTNTHKVLTLTHSDIDYSLATTIEWMWKGCNTVAVYKGNGNNDMCSGN